MDEAGGGNLHRGRGATAWGRRVIKTTGRTGATSQELEGASNSDLTIYPDLESLSVPKTSIIFYCDPGLEKLALTCISITLGICKQK